MNIQQLMKTSDSCGLTVLRVVTGIIYIGHGQSKVMDVAGTAGWLESLGIPLPTVSTLLVAGAEFVGGIMLIVELATRLAGAAQAFAMLIAILVYHLDNGMFAQGGYQWALLLMACSITLMIDGAGNLSIDRKLSNRA